MTSVSADWRLPCSTLLKALPKISVIPMERAARAGSKSASIRVWECKRRREAGEKSHYSLPSFNKLFLVDFGARHSIWAHNNMNNSDYLSWDAPATPPPTPHSPH